MSEGDYALTVYVWNRFAFDSNILIQVYFNHWPYGNKDAGPMINSIEPYKIQPGDMIGFPLFWFDETLILKFQLPDNAVMPEKYFILASPKVNYDIDYGLQAPNIPCGTGGKNSGVWTLDNSNTSWQFRINKLIIDPETVNVSVGVDIP